MKPLRVGVLFGGRSGEHEVSLVSAASVINGLNPKKYKPVPIGITKTGRWVLPRLPAHTGPVSHTSLRRALARGDAIHVNLEPGSRFLHPVRSAVRTKPIDVIFPVLHGTFGEDGTVQGLLDLAGIPYVGAGVQGSAIGMDKETQKRLFIQVGLPVAPYVVLPRADWEKSGGKLPPVIGKRLRYPLFVKPSALGSSVGISKVASASALKRAIALAATYGRKIIIEQGIDGREIEIAVLGNHEPKASLPGEIFPRRDFYDYAAKYLEDSTDFAIPARMPGPEASRLQKLAIAAFQATECEGMARVDFLVARRTGKPFLNEINTIPGFTAISMYPKLWQVSGLPYTKLLDRLIRLALDRHREIKRTRFSVALPKRRGGVLKD